MSNPTPPLLSGALPLLGHTLEFQRTRDNLFRRGYQELGQVFSIRMGARPAAVLIGPEYHQTFFAETDKKLSMHKTYQFLKAMFGEVAFAGPPDVYTRQRPILHRPFKGEKMPGYLKIMQAEIQAWLDGLGEQGELELVGELSTLAQNVAAHALMGRAFRERMGREFWDLYLVLSRAMDPLLPPNLPLPKFFRRDRAKAKLRAILRPIIAERRARPDEHDDILQDFVNSQYTDGAPVEEETIIGLILGLMFAGHETTVGQAAWTIIQLLQNPAYVAGMQAELAEKLPPGAEMDLKRLGSLRTVTWAVHETTRMNPSASMLIRLAEEDLTVGDYTIPKGWVVFITAAVAHRIPELFNAPEQHDPTRFSPERAEDRQHRFAMIGFGGGQHKCVGMNFANNEMAMITALLFQQFELELLTPDPRTHYGIGANRPEATRLRYRRKATAPAAALEMASVAT
jgi:sterol 14-demethylase